MKKVRHVKSRNEKQNFEESITGFKCKVHSGHYLTRVMSEHIARNFMGEF